MPPERIVSLCPSQTETLIAFGLGTRVVGRTRFCIHPAEAVRDIRSVGGTKEIKMDRLASLQPDLIIGEKEENTPEMIAELEARFPVYVTDVKDENSALRMIRDLGAICGLPEKGEKMATAAAESLAQVRPLPSPESCVYLIWQDPIMVVGAETYIQSVLVRCGFDNLALPLAGRYPTLTRDQLRAMGPRHILLSSEPFPFSEKHIAEYQALVPGANVRLVDGEAFSWYGVRMLEIADAMNAFLAQIAH